MQPAVSRTSRPLYGRFARYYDLIYHALVNYEGDVDFLEEVFRRYTVKPGTILDLGCGTGNHSVPLARRGYRVTGIDRSASMIAQAKKKASRLRNPPRFARADMRTFRLGQRFEAALCLFASNPGASSSSNFGKGPRPDPRHSKRGSISPEREWKSSDSMNLDTTRRPVDCPLNSDSSSAAGSGSSIGSRRSTRFRPIRFRRFEPCSVAASSSCSEPSRRRTSRRGSGPSR
ncbi:MAG: methyltransferase domain-containing protein, partial [Methanobacteriota archaeon]